MRIFKSPLYRIVNCDVTPVAISDRRSVDNTLDDDGDDDLRRSRE